MRGKVAPWIDFGKRASEIRIIHIAEQGGGRFQLAGMRFQRQAEFSMPGEFQDDKLQKPAIKSRKALIFSFLSDLISGPGL